MTDVRDIARRYIGDHIAVALDLAADYDRSLSGNGLADAVLSSLANAPAAVLAGLVFGPDGHRYLSTYCAHALAQGLDELHGRCGAAQRGRGDDSPPHCKVGPDEVCICPCHTEGVKA